MNKNTLFITFLCSIILIKSSLFGAWTQTTWVQTTNSVFENNIIIDGKEKYIKCDNVTIRTKGKCAYTGGKTDCPTKIQCIITDIKKD